jgi:pantoate--beta-alanine ligase
MEGRFRPGHLEGVALVCAKLFAIVGPCRAYFGEKDAQQLRVVRRMAADLDLPAEIVGCPTVRDPDGLALSSRNAYLGAEERTPALALSRVLFDVQDRVRRGESDPRAQIERARASLREAGVDAVDYVEIVHPETLEAVGTIDGPVLVCAAVRVGATRLIDNVMAAPAEAAAEVREELRT